MNYHVAAQDVAMTEDKLKRGKGLALVQWLGGDQI